MAYRHDQQFHRRKKRSNRALRFVFLILAIVCIVALIIFVDWIINNLNDEPQISRSSEATVQSANINLFRTPYFQFQADKSWREIESDTEDKFVYRSFQENLVLHELVVEVNKGNPTPLGNESVSRVLPAVIEKNVLSAIDAISPHCDELKPDEANRRQQVVKYRQVSFQCNPDSSAFLVVVGIVGDDEVIERETDAGTERTYKISYRDSTFYPSGRPLDNIVNTFQLFR